MQEQNEWHNEDTSKTLDVDIELTDDVVTGSANRVAFQPLFKHMVIDAGAVKFPLFKNCPCALYVKLQIEREGIGRMTKPTTCDLCTRNKESNSERIGAVLDGFNECMDQALNSEVGQQVIREGVKKHTGHDMEDFRAMRKEDAERAGLIGGERLRSDAQVLVTMVNYLLDMIDITELPKDLAKGVLSLVELKGKIQAGLGEPTELVKKAIDHADKIGKEMTEESVEEGSTSDEENDIRAIVDKIDNDMKKKGEDDNNDSN